MDPLAATSGYTPTSAALPGIMSRTEAMMLPYIQQYSNYVNQMDLYNNLGIPLCASSLTNPTAYSQGTVQNPNGSFNMESHLRQISETQARMQEYNMQRQIMERQNMRMQLAPLERIKTAAEDLQRKIVDNEQSQIMAALEIYKDAVKAAYYAPDEEVPEDELMIRVRNQYKSDTGHDLVDEIRENGHSSFGQGFINAITFGLFGQKSADETISEITDQDVSTTSRNFKKAGNTVGYTSAGATIGGVIGGFCGSGIFSLATVPIGAAIGAGFGTVFGLIKNLF